MTLRSLGLIVWVLSIYAGTVLAQVPAKKRPPLIISRQDSQQKLFDEFGILTSEDRSARFDGFFNELAESPGALGYVFLFCGKKCQYGEIEAHMRGIELKRAIVHFDRSRFVVLHGGFRDSFRTELWIAPAGTGVPAPRSTVNIRHVVFTERDKRRHIEPYDCCDDFSDVWNNIKP